MLISTCLKDLANCTFYTVISNSSQQKEKPPTRNKVIFQQKAKSCFKNLCWELTLGSKYELITIVK